jgi:hypothetical protein
MDIDEVGELKSEWADPGRLIEILLSPRTLKKAMSTVVLGSSPAPIAKTLRPVDFASRASKPQVAASTPFVCQLDHTESH